MRPFLYAALLLAAVPTPVSAQQATSHPKSVTNDGAPAPPACGRRGKNGHAICLRRLNEQLREYCALRNAFVSRFGERFISLYPPHESLDRTCSQLR